MKLIYTHENSFLVSNIKNIVENQGLSVFLKNEYAGLGNRSFAHVFTRVLDFIRNTNSILFSINHENHSFPINQSSKYGLLPTIHQI